MSAWRSSAWSEMKNAATNNGRFRSLRFRRQCCAPVRDGPMCPSVFPPVQPAFVASATGFARRGCARTWGALARGPKFGLQHDSLASVFMRCVLETCAPRLDSLHHDPRSMGSGQACGWRTACIVVPADGRSSDTDVRAPGRPPTIPVAPGRVDLPCVQTTESSDNRAELNSCSPATADQSNKPPHAQSAPA